MSLLIPIQYGNRSYPGGITSTIKEVAGHFDVPEIPPLRCQYSLHTEYSYGRRQLNSTTVVRYPEILRASSGGVPQLWWSKKWVEEFASFIGEVTAANPAPKIIEIHPPFSDYCADLNSFLGIYRTFEELIECSHPDAEILIENRCGTMYKGGSFILSTATDIVALSGLIETEKLRLRMVLDVPQLFTAHYPNGKITESMVLEALSPLAQASQYIRGIHLWGKKRGKNGKFTSHAGNLDTYFENKNDVKKCFLETIHSLFDDGSTRYFVPEVNSGQTDMTSIVNDLLDAGFSFIASH